MLSHETKCKLSDVLLAIGEGERQIEVIRQVLNELPDFETYASFQRIDRNKRKKITSFDLSKFLADNSVLHSEESCSAFIRRYDIDQDGSLNYTEFLNSVLTLTNKELRKEVTSRPNYFVGPKENLKPDVEYSLTKLFDKEITFYLGLDYLKIILHNRYDYNPMDAFATLDRNSKGYIDVNGIQNFFYGQSLNPKDEELFAILRRIDKRGNGKVAYDEFAEAIEIFNKSNSTKKDTQRAKSKEREDPLAKSSSINKELRFSESNFNRSSYKPSESIAPAEDIKNITFEGDSSRIDKYAPYKTVSPAPIPTYSPDKSRTSSLIRLTAVDGTTEFKVGGSGTPGAKAKSLHSSSNSFTSGKKSSLIEPTYKSPDKYLGASLKASDLVAYESRQSNKDLGKSVSPKKKVTFSADQEALSRSDFNFKKRVEKEKQSLHVNAFVKEKSLSPTRDNKIDAEKKELTASDRKAAFIAAELEKLKLENERALELKLGHRGLRSTSPRKFLSPKRNLSPRKVETPVRTVTLGDERESINKIEQEIRKRLESSTSYTPKQVQQKEYQNRESQTKEPQSLSQSQVQPQTKDFRASYLDKSSSPIRRTPTASAEKSSPPQPKVISSDKKPTSDSKQKTLPFEDEKEHDGLVFTLKQFVNIDKNLEVVKQDLALRPDFNILDFFRVFDRDNKAAINFNEFDEGLKQFAIYPNREELHLLVRKFDKDKDGRLRFSDFAELVTPKQSDYSNLLHNRTPFKQEIINSVHEVFSNETIKCISKVLKTHLDNEGASESLRQRLNKKSTFNTHNAFSYLDVDQDGSVDGDELREILEKHDTYVTDRELKLLVERFDANRDGKILYSEFVQEITPKSDKAF